MPHLQVDINQTLTREQKVSVVARMKQLFSEVMDTGTDHIAVSIREHGTYNLDIGRARGHEKGIVLINADIRKGRSIAQRRDLAVGFIDIFDESLGTPESRSMLPSRNTKARTFISPNGISSPGLRGRNLSADGSQGGETRRVCGGG